MCLQPSEAVPAMFCWELPTASTCPPVHAHQLSFDTACPIQQVLACNMSVWDVWWLLPLPSAYYYGFTIAALIDALTGCTVSTWASSLEVHRTSLALGAVVVQLVWGILAPGLLAICCLPFLQIVSVWWRSWHCEGAALHT